MDSLSSCYFCGTALDEPLATYRIEGPAPRSVTLCPGCRRKLDAAFRAAGLDETSISEEAAPEPATSAGDAGETTAQEDRGEDPLGPEADAGDILVDPEPEPDVPEGFETVDIGRADDGSSETGEESSEDAGTGDDESTDQVAETRETEEAVTARTTLSALEYNKVMRLLQNREFPVDREEIETVATNAYDLRRSECAEVIDLAVDRGLIEEDEEDGQLRRPAEE